MNIHLILFLVSVASCFTTNIQVQSSDSNAIKLAKPSLENDEQGKEILKRQKRSCFSRGKSLHFRNVLRRNRIELSYEQMAQLIHHHAICVNGICIACGENYIYELHRSAGALEWKRM